MVMGSSMPRFFAGPCLSVILPAPSSIFLTSPLIAAPWAARAPVARPTASASAAAIRMMRFMGASLALLHGDVADHAVAAVVGNQAGKFERAGLAELPEDLGCLARREPDPVGIVMLHVRVLLHLRGMREILLCGGEQEFMVLFTDIAQHEANLLAAFDLDPGGGIVHLVQQDLDGARGLFGIAGLAGRKGAVPVLLVGQGRRGQERGQRETEPHRRIHWYLQLVVHRNAHIFIFFIGVPCCRAGSGAGGVTS